MAPTTAPSSSCSGIPPGKVISPPLENSTWYRGSPGCAIGLRAAVSMSKYRAVRAFFHATAMLPSQARSEERRVGTEGRPGEWTRREERESMERRCGAVEYGAKGRRE